MSTSFAIGSSPRERGTLSSIRFAFALSRFIPARAGNAYAGSPEFSFRPVHPRASGNAAPTFSAIKPVTVHPRASGERDDRLAGAGPEVGSSRASGERSATLSQSASISGSSPRERGTLFFFRALPSTGAVHPRASGERSAGHPGGHRSHGSSPRERGTLKRAPIAAIRARFIPARAGNASDG